MKLSGNLSLNRYEWAKQKAKSLIKEFYNQNQAVYYDVGAGGNVLIQEIGAETKSCHSFDLSPINKDIQQWDIEQPFPYNIPNASIVTFLEIVEHLNNPWICLKNVSAKIEPGGFLILTTPNPKWSTSRIHLLLNGFLTCFTQSDLDLNHHVFTPWQHIIERLLTDNGFTIVEYVTLDGETKIFDDNLKIKTFLLQLPVRAIKKLIESLTATSKGMSYGIVARKI